MFDLDIQKWNNAYISSSAPQGPLELCGFQKREMIKISKELVKKTEILLLVTSQNEFIYPLAKLNKNSGHSGQHPTFSTFPFYHMGCQVYETSGDGIDIHGSL